MKVAMGEVRKNFAKYLKASEEEPVFVTRNGKITAVIEHIGDARSRTISWNEITVFGGCLPRS
ncbi:MAG: type II toxin-antitoxin system prevent-host-death family antitoxin, partial [Chloroflexota bacterium]